LAVRAGVASRRIAVVLWLGACASLLARAQEPPAGEWMDLFNGKNLDGWVVEGAQKGADGQPIWRVENGLLVCDAGRNGYGFLRYARRTFGDFDMHVVYRMAPAGPGRPRGNSGIGIRTCAYDPRRSSETRPSYAAYEIQLLDDAGRPPSAYGSGSLYRYLAPRANPVKPAPHWNTVDIRCQGPTISVKINDFPILEADQDRLRDLAERPASVPDPAHKPLAGYVCLQSHTGRVEFAQVRIRAWR